jgi:hypothetical protein
MSDLGRRGVDALSEGLSTSEGNMHTFHHKPTN